MPQYADKLEKLFDLIVCQYEIETFRVVKRLFDSVGKDENTKLEENAISYIKHLVKYYRENNSVDPKVIYKKYEDFKNSNKGFFYNPSKYDSALKFLDKFNNTLSTFAGHKVRLPEANRQPNVQETPIELAPIRNRAPR